MNVKLVGVGRYYSALTVLISNNKSSSGDVMCTYMPART